MNDDTAVVTKTTRKDRIKAIQDALTRALFRWHPDLTDDPRALSMTRRILKSKEQAERVYRELEDK